MCNHDNIRWAVVPGMIGPSSGNPMHSIDAVQVDILCLDCNKRKTIATTGPLCVTRDCARVILDIIEPAVPVKKQRLWWKFW